MRLRYLRETWWVWIITSPLLAMTVYAVFLNGPRDLSKIINRHRQAMKKWSTFLGQGEQPYSTDWLQDRAYLESQPALIIHDPWTSVEITDYETWRRDGHFSEAGAWFRAAEGRMP